MVKIDTQKYVYQGSPLYCLQKLQKHRERTLFCSPYTVYKNAKNIENELCFEGKK